jgi:ABC-type uncharacterized transport system permease subunit
MIAVGTTRGSTALWFVAEHEQRSIATQLLGWRAFPMSAFHSL